MMTGYVGRRFYAALLAIWVAIGLTACAGIPVQQMSDARQAIRAAETAGAEQAAPGELQKAREFLGRAEASMQNRQFRQARDEASEARRIATAALRAAQDSRRTTP